MRYSEPTIFVVDDKKVEIDGIIKYYNNLGVGCKYFNSDIFDGDHMPEKTYSDVNVIYLDLFFSEQPFDAELCSNWVQSIIPEKSFYILILWTKDPEQASAVLLQLKTINRIPFCYLVRSKIEFQIDGDEKYNFSALFTDINNELDNIPALDEIQIWKKSVKRSSNEVLGNLTKSSDPIVFNNKLKKIIVCHGGKSIVTNNDDNRKRLTLFDALDNVLVSNTKKNISDDPISPINSENLYNLNDISATIDKELNSWFHFKLETVISTDLIHPGLISEFNDNEWKKMYSIHDDKNVAEFISKQNGDKVKITSIALLISRPCDISQNKFGKNLKLLSGLKISNPIRKEGPKNEFSKGSNTFDSIKLFDHLFFSEDENDVTLLFDFRYNFSVPEDIFKTEFTNVRIFNKELLSEMQVEYSSYSSRLGITQVI